MVKAYGRKRGRGPRLHGAMQKAVQHVVVYKKTVNATAKEFGTSYHTLTCFFDQISKNEIEAVTDSPTCKEGHVGTRLEFSYDVETELVSSIFSAANIYFGLSPEKVRRLAYRIAVKHQQPVPPLWMTNELASEEWFSAFRKQHPALPIRSSESTDQPKGSGFNNSNVHVFFNNLNSAVKRHSFRPENMWYVGKTSITIADRPHRVGTRRNFKQTAAIPSAEQSCPVTVVCSVSAAGTTIPPYFVFPRWRFSKNLLSGAPVGSGGSAHPSGWLREEQFLDFLRHFVQHSNCSPQRPSLLLTDNHGSYLSMEALDFARENGIVWMTFPPNGFDLKLPMEQFVYGPLKMHIKAAIGNSERKTVTIHDIPEITTRVLSLVITPCNIMAGFEACGIFPLNPNIFTHSSATDHPKPLETPPCCEPACICIGGAHPHDAENHISIAIACDAQDHTTNTHYLQDNDHTLAISVCSQSLSSVTSGRISGHLDSPESSDEDEGFCHICMEPFPHSNSEEVCLQCLLRRKWMQSDGMGPSFITKPQNDLEPAHHTEGISSDIDMDIHDLQNHTYSDSSTTCNVQNPTHSPSEPSGDSENNSNQTTSKPTSGIQNHTHKTTVSTCDVENDTLMDLAPTHKVQDDTHTTYEEEHLHFAPGVTEGPHSPTPGLSIAPSGQTPERIDCPESSDEGFCQVCTEPFPSSSSEVVCRQCVLGKKWGQSDDMDCALIIPPITEPQNDLEPNQHPKGTSSDIHMDDHNLQNHTYSDLLTICDVQPPPHSTSEPTVDSENNSNQTTSKPTNMVQNHTHRTTVSTCDVENHILMDLSPTHKVQDDTHTTYVEERLHFAPGVTECPHSPTPGLLIAPSGQTPECLDSPESSDEGFCQVCMEPFPSSSSEVVCQQCVLGKKWGQSDDMDCALIIPPITEPHNDLEPSQHTEGTSSDTHMDDHNLQNHTCSDSSTICDVQPPPHSTSEPTVDSENNSNQTTSKPTNMVQNHTHRTTVSTCDVENHILMDLTPTHKVQDDTHTTYEEEHLHFAPGVTECPHSPTPGLLIAPSGQTPERLDSPESSDEDEGFCQVCMEPFPHSNSEVMCLQCVLRRQWLQSVDNKWTAIPYLTASHGILQPTSPDDDTTPSSSLSICSDQNHSSSNTDHPISLSVIHSPSDPALSTVHVTHDVVSPTHCLLVPTPEIQSNTHSTVVSIHDVIQNHIHGSPVTTFNTYNQTHSYSASPEIHTSNDLVSTETEKAHDHSALVESIKASAVQPQDLEPFHSRPGISEYPFSPAASDLSAAHGCQSLSDPSTASHSVLDHISTTHKFLDHCHTSELSVGPHSPASELSAPPSSHTSESLDSQESSHENEGFCQVCMKPFPHSNSEVVCRQCVLHKQQGQSDDVDHFITPPITEPQNEPAHHTEGTSSDIHMDVHDLQNHTYSDSSTTCNVQNPTYSPSEPSGDSENYSNQTTSKPTNGIQNHTHKTTVSTCDVENDTLMDLTPTHKVQDDTHTTYVEEHLHFAPGVTECPHSPTPGLLTAPSGQMAERLDCPESSDEGFCQVCMEPFPSSSSEVVCRQCVLGKKWGQSDDMDCALIIPPITEPHNDLEPSQHTEGTSSDIHMNNHNLQSQTYSDSSTICDVQPPPHSTSEPTVDSENNSNQTTSKPTNGIQNHNHKTTVSTCDAENDTLMDLAPTHKVQDDTHTTYEEQHLHFAPGVTECPHSPTPGPSTAPSGRTPECLDSSESSDEDEGVCQVCMEPFPHSNSEVVCLQCVLCSKWGQKETYL